MVNIKKHLWPFIEERGGYENASAFLLPDVTLAPEKIKTIFINEAVPRDPDQYFYSKKPEPEDLVSALALLRRGGIDAANMEEIVDKGIYITTAVKTAKDQYNIDTDLIKSHSFLLEQELMLFSGLKAIMLMGDVAKKGFNMIAKRNTGKNAIPSGSTYKIRKNEFFYEEIRLFPSYIMTGKNLLIEKTKTDMIADDIKAMAKLL